MTHRRITQRSRRRLRIRATPPRPPITPSPLVQRARRRRSEEDSTPPVALTRRQRIAQFYRRTDWGRHTAVVAAAAAAIGLIISGWGTILAARMAEDQLSSSNEDRRAAEREQASRVDFWYDEKENSTLIANRSLSSVRIQVGFRLDLPNSRYPEHGTILELGSVPPCTGVHVEINEKLLSSGEMKGYSFAVRGIAFTDTAGIWWVRREYESLSKVDSREHGKWWREIATRRSIILEEN